MTFYLFRIFMKFLVYIICFKNAIDNKNMNQINIKRHTTNFYNYEIYYFIIKEINKTICKHK